MSDELRHLMPLIVLGSMFLIALSFAFTVVFLISRMFPDRKPEPPPEAAPALLPEADPPPRTGG
ncbi:MAG: hypothetical protein AB7P02_26015 [Alphaproteobacteria bacterium]